MSNFVYSLTFFESIIVLDFLKLTVLFSSLFTHYYPLAYRLYYSTNMTSLVMMTMMTMMMGVVVVVVAATATTIMMIVFIRSRFTSTCRQIAKYNEH